MLDNFQKAKLAELQRQAAAEQGDAAPAVNPKDLQPVCELTQLVPDANSCPMCTYLGGKPSCENANTPGWCYVEGAAAGQCPLGSSQAIKFGLPPAGQTVIQCIQQTGGSRDGG